ncbi:MAG: DMT family transporter [Lentisphaeria bacterium]|nr:DMT family transporter [Lentisphaeria bacterium]
MIFAFIPVILWALGSICTSRSAHLVGAARANSWRLALAAAALGVGVLCTRGFPRHAGVWGWLILSGAVGLGLGDLCMMLGYRRVGPRIIVLVLLCLAVPVAGVSEWLWLGTELTWEQIALSAGILAGVGLAIAPGARIPARNRREVVTGVIFGVLAAVGQGLGTTISRVAYRCAEANQVPMGGMTAAWQRMIGGLLCTVAAAALFRMSPGEPPMERAADMLAPGGHRAKPRQVWFWITASAFLGPIIGLSVYQWVLVTQPGALVQAVMAVTPVAVIPFAWLIDGDRPDWHGVVGGLLACACAVALMLV